MNSFKLSDDNQTFTFICVEFAYSAVLMEFLFEFLSDAGEGESCAKGLKIFHPKIQQILLDNLIKFFNCNAVHFPVHLLTHPAPFRSNQLIV